MAGSLCTRSGKVRDRQTTVKGKGRGAIDNKQVDPAGCVRRGVGAKTVDQSRPFGHPIKFPVRFRKCLDRPTVKSIGKVIVHRPYSKRRIARLRVP